MEEQEVIRIPPVDKWMGSCPDCGTPVWKSYQVHPKTESLKAVYRCIGCKTLVTEDSLIPF